MIFPEVSIEEWSKKYPVDPRTTECLDCGGTITTNIPYITKDYAGFIAFKCPDCGKPHKAHVGTPISKNEKALWEQSFS